MRDIYGGDTDGLIMNKENLISRSTASFYDGKFSIFA